jgi:hypothetical protein
MNTTVEIMILILNTKNNSINIEKLDLTHPIDIELLSYSIHFDINIR